MFDYFNQKREGYAPHDRYKGFPFEGGYHGNVTWPLAMQWSPEAAAIAQAEADAVAAGKAPTGKATFANPGAGPLYVDGVNTTTYMVTGVEWAGNFTGGETCTLCSGNPFARMGLFYQDPGGDGPVLTQVGIGASDAGGGDTVWVYRFAE
jgi:hypothetical protein